MVDRNGSDPQSRTDPDSDLGLEQFESVAGDQGISLDELSRAYAELIGKGEDPYERPSPQSATSVEQVAQLDEAADDQPCELCPKSIIEAILFVGHPQNQPISADQLASLMRGVPSREVGELVEELNADYQQGNHPFQVVSRGAGYRLELRDEFAALRNVFYGRVREARLSQSVIDVLAVVAYQQGCTRKEVECVRGRPSGAILAQLVRRRLLRVERPEQKPRTPRYFVTDRFLQLFGLTSIDELPQSQDMD
jgi:segregation and condensation protein B